MTATTARGATPSDAETWLSVQDASAMLGVSPATLRRWSVAGEVEAFTTPGGHRRFALSTLRALLPHGAGAPLRLSTLGESPERLMKVIKRHARAASHESPWLRQLTDADREALRVQSRRLIESLIAHLDAVGRAERSAALLPAERAAAAMGVQAAQVGASLVEVVGVFIRFRALVVTELASVAVRGGLPASEATALVMRGGEAIDRVLEVMVTAHAASRA